MRSVDWMRSPQQSRREPQQYRTSTANLNVLKYAPRQALGALGIGLTLTFCLLQQPFEFTVLVVPPYNLHDEGAGGKITPLP